MGGSLQGHLRRAFLMRLSERLVAGWLGSLLGKPVRFPVCIPRV